jgi:Zn-finger nucleic acid-binding protein
LFAAPERAGVHGCGACGGIWADIATSQLIAAVLDPALVDLADRAASHAARVSRGAPLPEGGTRRCPSCAAALVRVNSASTNLDVCGAHGTWFDRGELQRVSRVLDGDRDRQIPRPLGPATPWVSGNTSLSNARVGDDSGGYGAAAVASDVGASVAIGLAFSLIEGLLSSGGDD